MGRAHNKHAATGLGGFDVVLGSRRGRSSDEQLYAAVPTAVGRRELARLLGLLAAGEPGEALETLYRAARTVPVGRPLLVELAQAVSLRAVGMADGQTPSRKLFEFAQRTGVRSDLADHVVYDQDDVLHVWPDGHRHSERALRTDPARSMMDSLAKDPVSGERLGQTACGQELNFTEYGRAHRGAWQESVAAPEHDDEDTDTRTVCAACAKQSGKVADCSEPYPPTNAMGESADARVRELLAADAPAQLAQAVAASSAVLTLRALTDELDDTLKRAAVRAIAEELADAPGWRLMRLAGSEGPAVARRLRFHKLPLQGLLAAEHLRDILEQSWEPAAEQSFDTLLAGALICAGADRAAQRREASPAPQARVEDVM